MHNARTHRHATTRLPRVRIVAFVHLAFLHFVSSPSERLSKTDEPRRQPLARLRVHLEPEVETNRADRRLVAQCRSRRRSAAPRDRCRRRGQTRCRYRRSPTTPRPPRTGTRSSALKIVSALPPIGKPLLIVAGRAERIEREAADRRVAAREEPFGLGQIPHRPSGCVCDRRRRSDHVPGKAGGQAEARVADEHDPAAVGQRAHDLAGERRLREADLRAEAPRGELRRRGHDIRRATDRPDRRACRRSPRRHRRQPHRA